MSDVPAAGPTPEDPFPEHLAETELPVDPNAPSSPPPHAGTHSGETVAAGLMPAWEVDELPEPPPVRWGFRELVGPGLMMAGAAIGGGEWLLGPKMANAYGGSIMWLALISILLQVVYNFEVMRYAVYCGEPIFVGFFRVFPGPKTWTAFYLFFDFVGVLPYLSANAAVPLTALFLGHLPGDNPAKYLSADRLVTEFRISPDVAQELVADQKAWYHPEEPSWFHRMIRPGYDPKSADIKAGKKRLPPELSQRMDAEKRLIHRTGCAIFMLSFLPLVFGGKIYTILVRMMVFKIIFIFSYLLFIGICYVHWSTWFEIFAGFVFFSKDDAGQWGLRMFRTDSLASLDWAALGAFAAIAGQGGMNNAVFSSYARDRGWGMGRLVGAIPSLVGGLGIQLAHTGKVFLVTDDSLRKWRGWFKVLYQDQLGIWLVGCIFGVAIPALISLQFLRGMDVSGDALAAATAEKLAAETGLPILWFLTLFTGFLVLAPNQITTTDGLIRRWTDVLWTGHPNLKELPGGQVRFVYFALLLTYLAWGLFVMVVIGKPDEIVSISGALMNFILGFSALHTLWVNVTLLPPALRPGWPARIGLVLCGVFFLGIFGLTLRKFLYG